MRGRSGDQRPRERDGEREQESTAGTSFRHEARQYMDAGDAFALRSGP